MITCLQILQSGTVHGTSDLGARVRASCTSWRRISSLSEFSLTLKALRAAHPWRWCWPPKCRQNCWTQVGQDLKNKNRKTHLCRTSIHSPPSSLYLRFLSPECGMDRPTQARYDSFYVCLKHARNSLNRLAISEAKAQFWIQSRRCFDVSPLVTLGSKQAKMFQQGLWY